MGIIILNHGAASFQKGKALLKSGWAINEPGGADYAHKVNTGSPGFSDLPTALH